MIHAFPKIEVKIAAYMRRGLQKHIISSCSRLLTSGIYLKLLLAKLFPKILLLGMHAIAISMIRN